MSYTYLQEQGEESSAECFSDIPPSALSRSKSIPEKFSCNGSETESCHTSQSGTTYKLSTESRGKVESMLSRGVFRAKTLAQPGKEQVSKASDPASGEKWLELLVKYDRDSSTWRTHRTLFDEVLPESSVISILPKWGRMTADGVLWERITSALPTSGIESGLLESWRSPAANEPDITVDQLETANGDPVGSNCRHYDKGTGRMAQIGLSQQDVAKNKWPTPRAQEAKHGEPTDWEMQTDHAGTKDSLRVQVAKREQNWPTPTANEDAAGTPDGKMQWMLSHAARSGCITRLEYQKQKWPTARASDSKGAVLDRIPGNDKYKGNLCEKAELETGAPQRENGKIKRLNPDWTEWLMGWPIGWTGMEKITELDWRDWSVDPADDLPALQLSTPTATMSVRSKQVRNSNRLPQPSEIAEEKIPIKNNNEWALRIKNNEAGAVQRVTSKTKHRVGRLNAIGTVSYTHLTLPTISCV